MREFLIHDKKMGFVDYSLLTIALEQGIQLISFDKQLINYYGDLIVRL
jgi:predicted nucleic acid-binding protein